MSLAEFNRKEAKFRAEKQAWDNERRSTTQNEAERKANEEKWKRDPVALLEAHGYTQDQVIDILAKGGANSPENRVRLLESKLEKQEREQREASEAAQENHQRSLRFQAIHADVTKHLADERFELAAREQEFQPGSVTHALFAETERLRAAGEDVPVEELLTKVEAMLDKRAESYAQSKKLKARFAPTPPAEKPKDGGEGDESSRQDDQVPTANPRRTITIKNRQQAVAPIRPTSPERKTRDQSIAESTARLAKMFASKAK